MSNFDNIRLGDGEQFAVGKSTMKAYFDRPARIAGGIFMICRSGRARMTVNMRDFDIREATGIDLLPDSIVMLQSASDDFSVEYFVYSRELFEEATFRIDHSFLKFLSENVVYQHTPKTLQNMNLWMEQQAAMYADREHLFRETITRNRLQNVFLDIYDHVKREKRINEGETPNRQEDLFRKYIALVHENFRMQHNVAFYAERMCITTRYLSAIVRNISGSSPKEIIDRIIMLELKVLLRSTNMSIQEISGALHFPDQSYMGRYFRKHAGVSPSEYRQLK